MNREELTRYLEDFLDVSKFKDYCPNGLQVEGRPTVSRIVFGVTASQALLDVAVATRADTIVVHHGYFWRGEEARLLGIRRQRIATLLKHDINLLAYHLPLDAHPALGNNAVWAIDMGWKVEGQFGDQNLVWHGCLTEPMTPDELSKRVAERLGRVPLVVGPVDRQIRRVAWCSGGAQGYFEEAINRGIDAYLTGEISEQTTHLARETGTVFMACGHHATERFGVQALADHLRREFGLDCEFVDVSNPV